MGLINYKDIDFDKSINKENKVIEFNGSEIQIIPYLSFNDKYDLIMAALQKSFEGDIFNEIKLQKYLDLHIVYLYTNIVFSIEDKADEEAIYDNLKSSNLLELIKNNIDAKELDELKILTYKIAQDKVTYLHSFGGFLSNIIEGLGEKLKTYVDIFKSIDFNKIKEEHPEIVTILQNTISNKKDINE